MRGARIAVALTFIALVFGALTANMPGAPLACRGFPWCRATEGAGPTTIHITHRIIGFLLLGHLIGMTIGSRRRSEHSTIRLAIVTALGLVVLQIIVAAGMVEMALPASLRAVHQAVGTALWIAVVAVAALAGGRSSSSTRADVIRESPSRGTFATPEGVST
jgi:heme A synthase